MGKCFHCRIDIYFICGKKQQIVSEKLHASVEKDSHDDAYTKYIQCGKAAVWQNLVNNNLKE